MTSRICKRCDADLLPSNFYDSNKSICRQCYRDDVAKNKQKRSVNMDEDDVELGVVEILDPDDLYVMKNSRLPEYKVGRSHNCDVRAKDLSKGQNFKMEIVRVYKQQGHLESMIHQRVKSRKFPDGEGREWFTLELETLEMIIQGVIAESTLRATSSSSA